MVDGQRREVETGLQQAMKVTAKLADMVMYDIPNVKLGYVQIDVYSTFRDDAGSAQRCILSTVAEREVADVLDWDEHDAEEVVRAFGGRYSLDDRGNPLPIDPEQPARTDVPAVFYEDDYVLRFLTAGESHGKGLTVIIEGMPAGLPLSEDFIAVDLRRRQGGYGRGRRQKIEQDRAEIIVRRAPRPHARQPDRALDPEPRLGELDSRRCPSSPIESEVEKVTRLRPGHADLAGTSSTTSTTCAPSSSAPAPARPPRASPSAASASASSRSSASRSTATPSRSATSTLTIADEIDWDAVEESPVRCADAASAETHGRRDRRRPERRRHARRRRRGPRAQRADGPRQPRPLGPQDRWPSRAGADEHPQREGRRDRRRVRVDADHRIARPRRDPPARAMDGPPVGARDEQRRRHRRRHHRRPGHRRPHRAQAHRDASALTAVRRPS